jgi:ACS family hexuronate transporter-like MFS transporter
MDSHVMPSSPAAGVLSRPRLWALYVVLLSATFINYANRVVYTQNAIPVQKAFGTDAEGYGWIEGNFGLGFALGVILFGVLADWVSVRLLYPAVVVAWSLAAIWSGMAGSLTEMGVSRFVLGLLEAGHWPCALRTTQRVLAPDQRTWGNSVLQSGAAIGQVLTPLLVGALYRYDPDQWRWAFYLAGAVGLPWAAVWLLAVREADLRRPVIQTDESSAGPGQARELEEVPFGRVFLTRRWWVLVAVVVLINAFWHYLRVWLPLTLEKDYGYGRIFVTNFTSLYYLGTLVGSLAAGWLTAHLARSGWNVHRARLAVFFGCAALSAALVPTAFLGRGPLLLACLLTTACGSLGLFPIYYSLNQELSAKHQGKVGGLLGFLAWFSMYFAHPAVGRLVEAHPAARSYLFAGFGLCPLLAFAILALFWGRRDAAPCGRRL